MSSGHYETQNSWAELSIKKDKLRGDYYIEQDSRFTSRGASRKMLGLSDWMQISEIPQKGDLNTVSLRIVDYLADFCKGSNLNPVKSHKATHDEIVVTSKPENQSLTKLRITSESIEVLSWRNDVALDVSHRISKFVEEKSTDEKLTGARKPKANAHVSQEN